MKNTKLRRILLLLACAVLLVSLSVGATLAYLTSTKTVTNTFTVGKVEIKLDEAVVNEDTGKALTPEERTTEGNDDVMMMPGRTIDKDPTVTVLKDSEDCYVRVKVTVTVPNMKFTATNEKTAEELFKDWANDFADDYIRYKIDEETLGVGFDSANWEVAESTVDADKTTIAYSLTYKKGLVEKPANDKVLEPVFTHIQVPAGLDTADLDMLKDMTINVVAEAIQAEGFKTQNDAWLAFNHQKNP